ncbi:shikimate kinase [Aquiflexum sp. LQ15W]|uniref:shikimate kinase n=1 Tax=Cognataquiflexum nitidum TaxID=2922272 RepID=UPI001F140782|nr:shikimate kinase [Cognataquiflexum nitidum]MCH6201455.1 shikimate kinase [Cognataquiflexum nitidum]
MKSPLKIVLVGMPGSGKSTFGRQIAKQLNFQFIDLDLLIEKETQKKIRDIFVSQGEGKFRELETLYLEKTLEGNEGFVLSTGGGTPCFNDNMEIINRRGVSVYLDVSLDEINRRLMKDQTGKRPMFAGLDEGEIILKLKNLLLQRESFYLKSKIILSGEDISTEHLMSALMGFFRN